VPELGGRLTKLLGGSISHHQAHPGFGETTGSGEPDSARSTCDDRCFAGGDSRMKLDRH
jgi:hypothetical protein